MAGGIARSAARLIRGSLVTTRLDALVGKLSGQAAAHALWEALRPDITFYPSPSRRLALRNGVQLDLDLSDYMQWSAYYSVERELRERLYGLASPGAVVIDVGSNIGEVLLGLARAVGPTGRAIGFEANPDTLRLCRANLALNPDLPADVHGVGLGDAEGVLSLHRPTETNSGADRFLDGAKGGVAVPVTTLDRFVAARAIERIDLIKIDVEGFEMKVLVGAEASLDRFRPMLFVELCDQNLRDQGSSPSALVGWLENKRYTVEAAADGEPLSSASPLADCFLDIIARPA